MKLESLVAQFSTKKLPPVRNWQPEQERSINMRVDSSGVWYYNGSAIHRQRMVALFSSVLRREGEQYYLVTPTEKLEISVERAPFVAVLLDVVGEGENQFLTFTDNCGNITVADKSHPLWLDDDDLPFVTVRDNLPALIARPVYYQLAELLVLSQGVHGVWSSRQFFPLA